MTTSGTSTFNYNRDQIIRAAARKIGAISSGETPDAQTTQDFADALNAMVKEWDARGIHVWTESEATTILQKSQNFYSLGPSSADNTTQSYNSTTLTATAATSATSISVASITGVTNGDYVGVVLDSGSIYWTRVNGVPSGTTVVLLAGLPSQASSGNNVYNYTTQIIRPLRIPYGRRYVYSSTLETPMLPMSRKDYRDLPNKSGTGTPTQFFYDPQMTTGQLFIWPAPVDVTSAFKFTWYRPIQDFNVAGDTPDLPQEWISTLIFNLASEMAPEYGVPLEQFTQIKTLAAEKLDLVSGWDKEPESTYFGVDFTQMGYGR